MMGPWHLKILTQYSRKDLKAVKNVDVVLSLFSFHSGTICVGNQFTAVAWLRWSNYFTLGLHYFPRFPLYFGRNA